MKWSNGVALCPSSTVRATSHIYILLRTKGPYEKMILFRFVYLEQRNNDNRFVCSPIKLFEKQTNKKNSFSLEIKGENLHYEEK